MKSIGLVALFSGIVFICFAQDGWHMQPVAISTRWAKNVNITNVLAKYPRPQLVRGSWTNLNGLWNYVITDSMASTPSTFEGQILVPYPLESALSGVAKSLQPNQRLWYRRTFTVSKKSGEKTLLHFGAVDYQCQVWVNGKAVGSHEGGYTAFNFDITAAVKEGPV